MMMVEGRMRGGKEIMKVGKCRELSRERRGKVRTL